MAGTLEAGIGVHGSMDRVGALGVGEGGGGVGAWNDVVSCDDVLALEASDPGREMATAKMPRRDTLKHTAPVTSNEVCGAWPGSLATAAASARRIEDAGPRSMGGSGNGSG